MNTVLKSLRKLQKGQGGFTLIELLIVILILGVIAAVVVLNVSGFLGRGEKEALCTEGDTVQAAVVAWAADHSATNCSGLTTTTLVPTYLLRAPKYIWTIDANCTCTGNSTNYHYPGNCTG